MAELILNFDEKKKRDLLRVRRAVAKRVGGEEAVLDREAGGEGF
jgi:hypothetical protein